MANWYIEKKELIPSKIVTRSLPKNYVETDSTLFQEILKDRFHPVNLYFVKNAYVLKDTLFKKFSFLDRFTHVHGLPLKRKLKRLALFLNKEKEIKKGIWLTNDWSPTYFHWFIDVLSKLVVSEGFIYGHKLLIPGYYGNFKFIGKSLDRLGVDYVFYNDVHRIKVEELIIVDLPRYCDAEILNKVRDKFLMPVLDQNQNERRVYISRAKAEKRQIINEREVMDVMLSFGFEIHYFEDYDLDKAVEIMRRCKYLVSIHGAGLTNMLFMDKKTKVLEFRQEGDNINGCYYSLANSLGIDYYYLLCKSTPGEIQVADLTVNITKLKSALTEMLANNF